MNEKRQETKKLIRIHTHTQMVEILFKRAADKTRKARRSQPSPRKLGRTRRSGASARRRPLHPRQARTRESWNTQKKRARSSNKCFFFPPRKYPALFMLLVCIARVQERERERTYVKTEWRISSRKPRRPVSVARLRWPAWQSARRTQLRPSLPCLLYTKTKQHVYCGLATICIAGPTFLNSWHCSANR